MPRGTFSLVRSAYRCAVLRISFDWLRRLAAAAALGCMRLPHFVGFASLPSNCKCKSEISIQSCCNFLNLNFELLFLINSLSIKAHEVLQQQLRKPTKCGSYFFGSSNNNGHRRGRCVKKREAQEKRLPHFVGFASLPSNCKCNFEISIQSCCHFLNLNFELRFLIN